MRWQHARTVLAGILLALGLAGCADSDIDITGCEPLGDMRPVCGMQTPEDMAALPDGRHLLLAHFGGMEGYGGSLSLFDTETEARKALFPGGMPIAVSTEWGEPDCAAPDPEQFSPHGTHLHQLSDGRWRYLVVNHGERETIELFEVLGEGPATQLAWRGCVNPAPETFVNDVVGLDNGDLVYTRMFHDAGLLEQLASAAGANTGDLWRWSRESGLRVLAGTEANQPNGIEISADNRHVFANMYFTGEVWKVDAETGEVVGRAAVANGDNSAWGSDGRLWVVTHQDSIANMLACFEDRDLACAARFEIFAIDPDTMAAESVFTHRGPPMGAATVAVPQNGRVYMGSFTGDRLVSVPDFGRQGN
jgi:hypothetical protein